MFFFVFQHGEGKLTAKQKMLFLEETLETASNKQKLSTGFFSGAHGILEVMV